MTQIELGKDVSFDVKEGWILELLTPEKFELYWPHIAKALREVPHTWSQHHTLEELFAKGLNQNMQVWAFGDVNTVRCLAFSEIVLYATGPIFMVFWAWGEGGVDAVPLCVARWKQFAKDFGCHMIEVVGRDGWLKHIRPLGFKREASVFRLPILREHVQ